jgi:hypothetical protein
MLVDNEGNVTTVFDWEMIVAHPSCLIEIPKFLVNEEDRFKSELRTFDALFPSSSEALL